MSEKKDTYMIDVAPLLRGDFESIRIPLIGTPEGITTVELRAVKTATLGDVGVDEIFCDVGSCSLCGENVIFGSNFCPDCGSRIKR